MQEGHQGRTDASNQGAPHQAVPSLRQLGEALHGLDGKADETSHVAGMWRLLGAVSTLLEEMQATAGKPGQDPKGSIGRRIASLRDDGVLDSAIYSTLQEILQTRNLYMHFSGSASPRSLDRTKHLVIQFFEWYLSSYQNGPRYSSVEAKAAIWSAAAASGVEVVSKKVFLCYASEDRDLVGAIHQGLFDRGHEPWMDKVDLIAGQPWESAIRKAIRAADCFVAFLSNRSVSKRGFVQKEVRFALETLGEIPPDQIYFIPVRLEACEVPDSLSFLHWVDLFDSAGLSALYRAIESPSPSK